MTLRVIRTGIGTKVSAVLVAMLLTGCTDGAQVPGPTEELDSREVEATQLREFNIRVASCMTDNGALRT